jgi:hypothetical protein
MVMRHIQNDHLQYTYRKDFTDPLPFRFWLGEYQMMKKGDKGKKIMGMIAILAIIVSIFGGAVSAEDLSGGGG